jgi:hypothetical protein
MSFVYVLSNETMPGLYKVGHTDRDVQSRIAELNASTSAPMPFRVEGYYQMYASETVEQTAHKLLAAYRVNNGREFFRTNSYTIAIKDAIAEAGDVLGPRSQPFPRR